jgi:glyoxylase-like metal-dependent hydrolase (beta-lactamase superfamily II)
MPIDNGWELELGDVVVRALHTPGHRPEHTAFALIDRARGSEPWAVLSGDSLFVGDVARPDLAIDRDAGAREIFDSLHGQLLALPDACELWPGHLGGSMCGGPGMDTKVSSTIGYERAHNLDRPPRAGDRPRRARRGGRRARGAAVDGGRYPQHRGLPARRHDELARGASAGGEDRAPVDRRSAAAGRRGR